MKRTMNSSRMISRRNFLQAAALSAAALSAMALTGCGSSGSGTASSAAAGSGAASGGTTYKVGIVNYVDDASLNQIVASVEARLDEVGAERGVTFNYADYYLGNDRLMAEHGANWHDCDLTGTVLHVTVDGAYAGHIVIADVVKDDAEAAVRELHDAGVRRCVMLTGDRADVAEAVGGRLGLDEVRAQLLPQDKVAEVERLLAEEREGGRLAFVGDGINDAPVLTRADVGIAMGAMGSDAAIEAADVVLMDDRPSKIASAMRVARKTMRIVWQNIVFAIGVKVLILVLAALGLANMWLAVFGDVGVAVIAILNAMRAMRVERH